MNRDAMARDRAGTSGQTAAQENSMRRILLDLSAAIAITLAAVLTSASGAAASSIMIVEAYARASATPVARAGAAYVSVMNHGGEADRLVSAATPAARAADIHMTEVVDGVMKMKAAGPLDIPAMGTIEMKPGGYHIMLIGLKAPLRKGDEIEITLSFEKAGEVAVKVPVGDVAQGGHDHGAEGSDGSSG
jgi:copper(I)-binding protein